MDWYASSPSDDGLSTVTAKDADVSLSEKDLLQLHSINPLEDSDEFGIEGRSVCPGNWYRGKCFRVCNFWTSTYEDHRYEHIPDAFSLWGERRGIFFKKSLRKNVKIVASYGCFTMACIDNITLAFIDIFIISFYLVIQNPV